MENNAYETAGLDRLLAALAVLPDLQPLPAPEPTDDEDPERWDGQS